MKYKNITLKKFVKSDADSTRVVKAIDASFPWYTCVEVFIGGYYTQEEAELALTALPLENNVVGYIIEGPEYGRKIDHVEFDPETEYQDEYFEGDESPEFAITYDENKTAIARYTFGGHKPGESRYLTERCPFKTGDLVWVVQPGTGSIPDGMSAMYPARVVQTLDFDYVKKYYEAWFPVWWDCYLDLISEKDFQPTEEFKVKEINSRIENLLDIEWDSIVVRPLILLREIEGRYGNNEEEFIPRYMIFPYKKFSV